MGDSSKQHLWQLLSTNHQRMVAYLEDLKKGIGSIYTQLSYTPDLSQKLMLNRQIETLEKEALNVAEKLDELESKLHSLEQSSLGISSHGEDEPDSYQSYKSGEYIQRSIHEEEFWGVIQNDSRRLYSIETAAKSGKTWLLSHFRAMLRNADETKNSPVCLVPLDRRLIVTEAEEVNAFEVFRDIRKQFRNLQVSFPLFDRTIEAIEQKDSYVVHKLKERFIDPFNVPNSTSLSEPHLMLLDDEVHPATASLTWNSLTFDNAMELSLVTLVIDIKNHCGVDNLACILLDSVASLNHQMSKWLNEIFMQVSVFRESYRPNRLRIVIVGDGLPDYLAFHGHDEVERVVVFGDPLVLSKDDIRQLAQLVLRENNDELVNHLWGLYCLDTNKYNIEYISRHIHSQLLGRNSYRQA